MTHSPPPEEFLSYSTEDTLDHARSMGQLFPNVLVLLQGPLGAGKTLWTRGFSDGIGLAANVNSPSYTVLNVYRQGGRALYHLDLYRLECFEEIYDVGLFEAIDAGFPCVVEWPERVPELGRLPHLSVQLAPQANEARLISWKWNA